MKKRFCISAAFAVLLSTGSVMAAQLVVMEARGTGLKSGAMVDSEQVLELKEGERLVLIGPDGRSVTLRGPFRDKPVKDAPALQDRSKNLTALLSSRDARTSAVGVVRAGAQMAAIPDPWLLDVAESGRRCLPSAGAAMLWREDKAAQETVGISPADRSWRIDIDWPAGQDRVALPDNLGISGLASLVVIRKTKETNLSLSSVPVEIPDPLLIASWMVHKGCAQQSDALLRQLAAKR